MRLRVERADGGDYTIEYSFILQKGERSSFPDRSPWLKLGQAGSFESSSIRSLLPPPFRFEFRG